jgi:hypothetical protein
MEWHGLPFLVSGFEFQVVHTSATTNQETAKTSAEFHIACGTNSIT